MGVADGLALIVVSVIGYMVITTTVSVTGGFSTDLNTGAPFSQAYETLGLTDEESPIPGLFLAIGLVMGAIQMVMPSRREVTEEVQEQEEEDEMGYVPEVEEYAYQKKKEELNRLERILKQKEREVDLRDRKREYIQRKWGGKKK